MSTSSNRRDFLRTVILSSGSVYLGTQLGCGEPKNKLLDEKYEKFSFDKDTDILPRSQYYQLAHKYIRDKNSLTLSSSKQHSADVVIIGSGPSGLMAAIQLQKQGYSVAIIENELHAGGATASDEYNGIIYPLAAIYFVDYNQQMQELCSFAGVEPIPAPPDAVALKNITVTDFWTDTSIDSLPIPTHEKSSIRKFRDTILSLGEDVPVYPLPKVLTDKQQRLDAQSVAKFLEDYPSPTLRLLLNLYTKSSMGGTIDEVNTYSFLNFYSSEISKENAPRYTFKGGLTGLTHPICEKLGKDIFHLGHLCINITNEPHPLGKQSVRTTTINRHGEITEFRSKHVVVATQKFMMPTIIPTMPDIQKSAIASLSYSPFVTVHLCSNEPLMRHIGFDTWYLDADPLFTDIIIPLQSSSSTHKQASYVSSVYCPRSIGQRASLQSDEIIAAIGRQVGEKVVSLTKSNSESILEIRCYAWGHSIVIPRVGTHNGIAQTARQSFENIHFCNTDNDSVPYFENAIANGSNIAETICKILQS